MPRPYDQPHPVSEALPFHRSRVAAKGSQTSFLVKIECERGKSDLPCSKRRHASFVAAPLGIHARTHARRAVPDRSRSPRHRPPCDLYRHAWRSGRRSARHQHEDAERPFRRAALRRRRRGGRYDEGSLPGCSPRLRRHAFGARFPVSRHAVQEARRTAHQGRGGSAEAMPHRQGGGQGGTASRSGRVTSGAPPPSAVRMPAASFVSPTRRASGARPRHRPPSRLQPCFPRRCARRSRARRPPRPTGVRRSPACAASAGP